MKITNCLLTALIVAGCAGPAATPSLLQDVTYLASDELQGRGVGTEGLDRAADYVADRFAALDLSAPRGTYLQPFRIDSTAPAAAHAGVGGEPVANVVGVLEGRGALAGETVVIGAHYDHLGLGGESSLQPDLTGTIHNGADDNASGTAALMDIARQLVSRSAENVRTLVFVAFTAEELGLIGSGYYVENPVRPNASTYAMLNLDMVGRMVDSRVSAFGAESAQELTGVVNQVNETHGLEIAASGDGFGRSDHQSFFVKDIPVLHFFTGTHPDYHATTDDVEHVNIEGLERISAYVSDLAWELATRTETLTFVPAEAPTLVASSGERPYLGTVPDMTSSPGGVRVSSITPGSPADEAGMQGGDILVGLGEHEIGDLYDMTNALNAHSPGDQVTLRVNRDGTILNLRATLRSRGG